jgi:uncharacterized protein HemY
VTIERLLEAHRALDAGELDRAEQIYRQVADMDPRSAIAAVGLARVAQRRGTEEEAARLAESALLIDPDNAAARGLAGPVGTRADDGAQAARRDEVVLGPPPDDGERNVDASPASRGLLERLLRRGRR